MRCSCAFALVVSMLGMGCFVESIKGDGRSIESMNGTASSDLKQSGQSIGRDSISIANFGENELQFLVGHFLTSTNVVQDPLQIRQNNSVFRILSRGDDFLLESSRSALRVTLIRREC